MTTYRLYPSTNGPGSSTADATDYIMGISFEVTSPGLFLAGYWWWVADASQSAGAQDFAVWLSTGTGTGTYVTASKVTSGALALGWNYVPYGSPLALAANTEYRAVTHTLGSTAAPKHGYSATGSYFTSGGPAVGGITTGPLFAYSGAGGTFGTTEPFDTAQMCFDSGGTNVTTQYPADAFNAGNYWLDVQISTGAPPPPAGHKDQSGSPLPALLAAR